MLVIVGKTPDAHLYRCWVDGVEVTNKCFAADSDEGWAICYVTDEDGKFVLDYTAKPTKAQMEKLFGYVFLKKSSL